MNLNPKSQSVSSQHPPQSTVNDSRGLQICSCVTDYCWSAVTQHQYSLPDTIVGHWPLVMITWIWISQLSWLLALGSIMIGGVDVAGYHWQPFLLVVLAAASLIRRSIVDCIVGDLVALVPLLVCITNIGQHCSLTLKVVACVGGIMGWTWNCWQKSWRQTGERITWSPAK